MTTHLDDLNQNGGASAPPNLHSTSFYIDPENEVDIARLIALSAPVESLETKKMLELAEVIFAELPSIARRHEPKSLLLLLSQQLARFFSGKLLLEYDSFESHYYAWIRVAADIGDVEAVMTLLKYSVRNDLESAIAEHWARLISDASFQRIDTAFDVDSSRAGVEKLNEIISLIAPVHAELALQITLKLMRVCESKAHLNGYLGRTKKIKKRLLSDRDCRSIIVLDQIAESADRNVKETCKRYESLTTLPVKLALIGDVKTVKETLDSEFPWFSHLTSKIANKLLLRQIGNGTFYLSPILVLGPPGVGKSSYISRLAELVEVPSRALSLAGKNDNRDLSGTARGWSTGHPSMPVSLINDHQIGNPIVLLDEVDKAGGSDHNGRVVDTLLTLIEPATSKRVFDDFLCGHADLSGITWIFTANDIKQLPTTLLSRLEVETIDAPLAEHYPAIIKKSIHSFCAHNGIHSAHIPEITEADWAWLKRYFKSPRLARKAAEKWLEYRLLTHQENRLN